MASRSKDDGLREAVTAAAHAAQERRFHRASREASSWKSIAKTYMTEVEETRAHIDALLMLNEADLKVVPIEPVGKKGDRHSTSTACALLSDLHIDERVRPQEVPGGRNRFGPEVAEERIDNFARNFIKLIDSARATTSIHQAALFALGDNFSGWIHPELMHSTEMTPIESIDWLQQRFVRLIDYLLKHSGLEKLHLLCMVGNHSRITMKEHSAPATASLEYILYRWLASHYGGEPRVKFQVPQSKREVTTISGVRVRWLHGNQWGYNRGTGGVVVPMQGAIKTWESGEPADLTVCGHWHTYHPGRNTLINGSLIGYTAYSSKFGPWEPPQQAFFLLSDKYRRVTMHAPVFVE